jgi:hypothetical protein
MHGVISVDLGSGYSQHYFLMVAKATGSLEFGK